MAPLNKKAKNYGRSDSPMKGQSENITQRAPCHCLNDEVLNLALCVNK